ncbi:MAG: HU family DNA-binding protein [Bacillota bacterium]
MNKQELVSAVAEKTGLQKKQVEAAITSTLEVIQQTVSQGDKIQLVGFGTFEPRTREAREGRNPKTGEPIQIPATTLPVFKAGKAFKDSVHQQ